MRASRKENISSEEGVYESFADMVLCTVIVLITLVVVLALNVVTELNITVDPNHFSGGASRPWLYIQAQSADYSKTVDSELASERAAFQGQPSVLVNLFSPSAALSSTRVKDGQTVSARERQSFHGQLDLSAYHFLQLATGISPGNFYAEGNTTALMLPKFVHKNIVLEPNLPNGYSIAPENQLALKTMALAWPIYKHDLYPRRAQTEYQKARTIIYLETLETQDGTRQIMIGHSVFELPKDIENGRLGWLIGFSSGLTEVVYLGEAWEKPAQQLNKRIDFFDKNGFPIAAAAYREFSYPGALSASQQQLLQTVRAANPTITKEQAERYVRSAEAQRAISAAILTGQDAKPFLPPLLAHRDAWDAYTKHCMEAQSTSTPPEWLLTEFLQPLGFDQTIVRGLKQDQ